MIRAYLVTALVMAVLAGLGLAVFGFDARFYLSTPLIVAASIVGAVVLGKQAVQDMQEGRK